MLKAKKAEKILRNRNTALKNITVPGSTKFAQEKEFEGFSDLETNNDAGELDINKSGLSEPSTKCSAAEIRDKKSKADLNKITEPSKSGVVYIGRLPHGFHEKEMKSYFSQFGEITKLRMSRNRISGKPKHYAFIEFASEKVAKVVTETMDNYLIFNHILRCRFIPSSEVPDNLFKGANKSYKCIPWRRIASSNLERIRSPQALAKSSKKEKARRARRDKQLSELGINPN